MPLCERTRYQKQTFTVPNMRAVLKKASWGTRRIFRGVPCQKQPPAAPDASSVRETAPALFVRSGGPFPCSFDGTRYQKRPPLGGEQT